MPTIITEYEACRKYRHNGTLDLDTNTIMLALVANTYTPDYALHATFSDVSANELPAANGYPAGGVALTGGNVDTIRFDADDLVFSDLGVPSPVSFRYGVLYALGTLNAVVNPLIAAILFDNTPADITINASNYQVIWNPSGIITF